MYPVPYAWFLASCSMGSHMLLFLLLTYISLCCCCSLGSLPLRFCSLFYLGCSPIDFWNSLSGYVHPGIACLAFWVSDWPGAFWASLSDYPPLSGVYPNMTFFVKLVMIGHCCDCLGGWLNCLVSTCWLIIISKGWPCTNDCVLAHSSNGFRIASGWHKA